MDDFLWLNEPIHQNRLKGFDFKEDSSVTDFLKISYDGSIMAVMKSKVESHYKEQNVFMIKHGYEKMPEKMKVDDEESLFKYLAYFVDIE